MISSNKTNPTFFLEGVVHDKADMVDFEGPLSLILLLLSKNKIEIRDIQVAEILDQYLDYLKKMEELDLEIASEFIQMASYLLYIKTQMLLKEEKEISELEQLIASLEQLKAKDTFTALKSVTPLLEAASLTGIDYHSKPPEPMKKQRSEYPYTIDEADLLRALLKVFTRSGASVPEPLVFNAPQRIVYSVRDKSRELIERLKTDGETRLSALYASCGSRSEIIATFLCLLELCSMGNLMLTEQNGEYMASFTGDADTSEILESMEFTE